MKQAFGVGRFILAGICITACVVWACSQMLLLPSNCRAEMERAFRAEMLVTSLTAKLDAGDNTGRLKSLEQQITDLQQQLKLEREQHKIFGAPPDMHAQLVQSLQKENIELRKRNEVLSAQVDAAKLKVSSAGLSLVGAGGDSVNRVAERPPTDGNTITVQKLQEMADRGAVGVLVIVCKRPQYLTRAMESYLRLQRNPDHFPIVISQDGHDQQMTQLVESTYVDRGLAYHMHHTHDPNAVQIASRFGPNPSFVGYVRIAQHYGFALGRMFDEFRFQQVIILEEDMEVSPDFFSYFDAMLPLLKRDPKLFCVSAWNDNGYDNLVLNPNDAFRTDFFPGLGWMLHKSLWDEIRHRWPSAFWDEFMRRPDVRKGRHCIRPDISRTFTFGQEGTSQGQFFGSHLARIKMNDVPVDWSRTDLSYLESANNFEQYLMQRLQVAKQVSLFDIDAQSASADSMKIEYSEPHGYAAVATKFGLMRDEKEGIRRMSYRGLIPFAWRKKRVFLYTTHWPGNVHV